MNNYFTNIFIITSITGFMKIACRKRQPATPIPSGVHNRAERWQTAGGTFFSAGHSF
jgi:hypothetical protein